MQLLAALVALAAIALTHADVGFYFFQGFQTKNAADSYYVSITATTDRGYIATTSSVALRFDSRNNLTLSNSDNYVTNLKATLYQYGSSTPLATLLTNTNQKLLSFNFYVIAHTASYDPLTGTNVPKLSYGFGVGDDDYTGVVAVVGANHFFSTSNSMATYTPPKSFPVFHYQYPYDFVTTYMKTSATNVAYGQSKSYSATFTSSSVYEKGPEEEHKWCIDENCASAQSASYAGIRQSFFVVYYGNAAFANNVGSINFGTPL